MLIGIDPHKTTHTATAVEPSTQQEVASIRIDASLREYRRMLAWAKRWPQRRWAVENAEGLGRHLTSWLLARGEDVVDVPTTPPGRGRRCGRRPAPRAPRGATPPRGRRPKDRRDRPRRSSLRRRITRRRTP